MRTKLAPVHHASHLLNLVALVALLGVVLPLIVIDDLGQTRGVAVRLKERGVERGATEQLAPCFERKEEGWWWKKKLIAYLGDQIVLPVAVGGALEKLTEKQRVPKFQKKKKKRKAV